MRQLEENHAIYRAIHWRDNPDTAPCQQSMAAELLLSQLLFCATRFSQ
jgi:hypothetical protein